MKVSELIKKAQEAFKEHGDIEVLRKISPGGATKVNDVRAVETFDVNNYEYITTFIVN